MSLFDVNASVDLGLDVDNGSQTEISRTSPLVQSHVWRSRMPDRQCRRT
jgi:hypothetical protein